MPLCRCAVVPLHLPQKSPRYFEYQILIKLINTNNNTVFAPYFYKFPHQADKSATDHFNIIPGVELLGRDFNFSITVNKQPKVVNLILGNRNRMSFEGDELDNAVGSVNFREILFICSYKYI